MASKEDTKRRNGRQNFLQSKQALANQLQEQYGSPDNMIDIVLRGLDQVPATDEMRMDKELLMDEMERRLDILGEDIDAIKKTYWKEAGLGDPRKPDLMSEKPGETYAGIAALSEEVVICMVEAFLGDKIAARNWLMWYLTEGSKKMKTNTKNMWIGCVTSSDEDVTVPEEHEKPELPKRVARPAYPLPSQRKFVGKPLKLRVAHLKRPMPGFLDQVDEGSSSSGSSEYEDFLYEQYGGECHEAGKGAREKYEMRERKRVAAERKAAKKAVERERRRQEKENGPKWTKDGVKNLKKHKKNFADQWNLSDDEESKEIERIKQKVLMNQSPGGPGQSPGAGTGTALSSPSGKSAGSASALSPDEKAEKHGRRQMGKRRGALTRLRRLGRDPMLEERLKRAHLLVRKMIRKEKEWKKKSAFKPRKEQ
jgi:hypothetical protein